MRCSPSEVAERVPDQREIWEMMSFVPLLSEMEDEAAERRRKQKQGEAVGDDHEAA